ncbi:MAG: B12-binding domain-containing radical SAM protein [Phycisphaerae bacterium]|nr:B12-binding domain-containing radical SAM protein [Phycisphaerae bacterium]
MTEPVLLVSPPAEVPRECYDTPDYPAIGIGYVAGYLQTHGIPVRVIDGKLARKSVAGAIDEIVAARPRILGLTAMTHMIVTTHRIASAVKARCPDTTVVLGGFHGSSLPERTLREFPAFDYIVVGEGEIAFLKLVNAVLAGRDPCDILGIASREGERVRVNGRGEIPDDLDDLGMPAWELFPPANMYPIMSQRGCPFGCNFCSRPYGRKLRHRSPPHVLMEIRRNYEQFGCRRMDFYDETFSVRKEYVAGLCDKIVSAGLAGEVRFWAYVHANTIDLPTAKKMKLAGFDEVGMGVESGNAKIMRKMKKGVGVADVLRASGILKQAGMKLGVYFIIGHPYETKRDVKDSIDLAARINPDSVAFGLMTPYPGSEIWELATHGEGGYRMIPSGWEDFNKQIGKALELEHLPRRAMELMQLQAYLTVYLRTFRFREMFQAAWINRKRILFILRKLLSSRSAGSAGSSSWLQGSARPQTLHT